MAVTVAEKRFLLKLPKEISKTFWKYVTRKEADTLGPSTDLIHTSDIEVSGRLLVMKLAYMWCYYLQS